MSFNFFSFNAFYTMKRRSFLNITLGAAIIHPLIGSAGVQEVPPIAPPPSLIPTPVSDAGKWFMDEPTRIGWFLLRYSDAQKSAEKFVQQVAGLQPSKQPEKKEGVTRALWKMTIPTNRP